MIWDVVVVGSGPAGNAVVIHCSKAGLRCVRITSPQRRGTSEVPETLPAVARPLLDALGIEVSDRFGLRQQYAMSSAWGSDSLTTRHSICNPSGPGWFVDRPAFDAELAGMAAGNGRVAVLRARLADVSREEEAWTLHLVPEDSTTITIRAAVVVDATGRASAFARRIGIRRVALDRLISVNVRAVARGSTAGEALVEAAQDGWWFSALTPRGDLSLSWFTDGRLLERSDRSFPAITNRLRTAPHTAARVECLLLRAAEFRAARTDRLEQSAGVAWIAVGDAAVACDPLGSNGLVHVFESAAMASDMIVRHRTHDPKYIRCYQEFQIYYLQRFLNDRHHFYAREQRWPAASFWRGMR